MERFLKHVGWTVDITGVELKNNLRKWSTFRSEVTLYSDFLSNYIKMNLDHLTNTHYRNSRKNRIVLQSNRMYTVRYLRIHRRKSFSKDRSYLPVSTAKDGNWTEISRHWTIPVNRRMKKLVEMNIWNWNECHGIYLKNGRRKKKGKSRALSPKNPRKIINEMNRSIEEILRFQRQLFHFFTLFSFSFLQRFKFSAKSRRERK